MKHVAFIFSDALVVSKDAIQSMYPFWSALAAVILAQLLKPIFYFLVTGQWKPSLVKDSGGFPSSHSAMVSALALSVGIRERFGSTLFAIALTLALIVIYDAANVRYYSGQNIKMTKQLAKDVQEQLNTEFLNPIYDIKLKDVLGHKWTEVFGGILIGCAIAFLFHFAG